MGDVNQSPGSDVRDTLRALQKNMEELDEAYDLINYLQLHVMQSRLRAEREALDEMFGDSPFDRQIQALTDDVHVFGVRAQATYDDNKVAVKKAKADIEDKIAELNTKRD